MNPYEVYQRRLIYIFGIPDAAHKGLLKIGETTIKNLPPTKKNLERFAKERIDQYTRTAGIDYNLLHFELAVTDDGRTFRDYDVHRLLKKYRHAPKGTKGREWFKIDLQNAIKAIAAVKQGKKFISVKRVREDIIFRPEQETAINKTVEHFKKGGKDFLWNAKMRFGKTFCALEVVRRMSFDKTIIITHRPVVDAGWYDDFNEIFRGTDYIYGNKGSSLEDLLRDGRKFVYFASMQDLRGSETVGGKFDKNYAAFKTKWDLVIVDEAHEGTQTDPGQAVIKKLVKKNSKLLDLTGTPFNLIDAYNPDSVFTWDYVMEQRAKADWDKNNFGDPNPYADLPRMNIFTYDLGKLFNYIDSEDISFSFKEFFSADNGRFVHEPDVKSFLNLLVKADDNNYPFSRADFREMFKHTFWIIPGVKEGLALSKLLKRHPVFGKFEIVNVAGDGDSEDKTGEALAAVRDAIDNHDYTITLSCGKLTAGVTVPEWTAVFMLAGSYSTSATSYLQTIFRVQSPCNKGGVSKQNCYVFDFAPDRALRVIAESVKVSTRAGKTKDSQREILGELLNFCPVIAVEGSEMKSLDANRLLQRIKHAQAERAVRNGFEDSNIYNDTLRDLSNVDWKKFDALKKIIGSSKPTKKPADIPVNDQGLTNEQYNDKELTRKPRTPEEKEAARKAAVKRNAISILRGISIRMPFLIYGAEVPFDEDISIDRFIELVDDASWLEFMPAGVTKELFKDFIPYYDPEVFIQAGNIIRQRAKAADKLRPTERINKIAELFATFKNPDKETVLTPWRVVKLHIDSAFAEDFFTPDKKILEINSKTGLYPLYVTHKIFRARLGNVSEDKIPLDELRRLWDMTVADNVFVICKTPMAKTITRRTLLGYRGGSVNAHCFDDLINQLKNKAAQFLKNVTNKNFWNKGAGKMFFDAVVGNPPYQVVGSGDNKNFATPIYHEFIKIAYNKNLTKRASLIHPARFLFNAGATPGDFAEKFLAD
ncbi:MAG: DEAD/DEAH box helicase family protein, partial [Selenomonadaceae bacterium]|nr:DEAD/DEAH box helicase family protein [Selenomonadaceae bacterium]